MRLIPCFWAIVCITWYADSRLSASIACHVELAIPRESWSAPRTIVSRSWRSCILTFSVPETPSRIATMIVRDTISLCASVLGKRFIGFPPRVPIWQQTGDADREPSGKGTPRRDV